VTGRLRVVASAGPHSDSVSVHTWAQARSEAATVARSRGGNTRVVFPVAARGDEVDECRCRCRSRDAMEGASAPHLPGYACARGQCYAGA
jgi:hypothetical protein